MKIRSFIILLLSLLTLPALAAEPEKYTQIRLIAEKATIQPGETIIVGIEETIYPGWHVYWKNPGDSGEPTSVTWTLPEDFETGTLEWPVPHKLPFGPLTNFGYENRVVLLQELSAPLELPEGPITLTANIDLLVCEEICIPESHTAWLTLNGPGATASPDTIAAAMNALPLDVGWEAKFFESDGKFQLEIETDDISYFADPHTIEFFPEDWGMIANSAAPQSFLSDSGVTFKQDIGERDFAEVPVLKGILAYEDPQGVRQGIRLSALKTDKAAPVQASQNGSLFFVQAIIFAIIGGLILNLMPCVFPVLSMKALSLCKLKDKEEDHARAHGLAYTAGIMVSFAAIAGLLLVLKAGGQHIGWGFQLQSPIMVMVLAYLLFTIGLNLAGFFEIQGAFTNLGAKLTQNGHYGGSFFTGVLATLVATPCTAPFMGAAMGFALTQGSIVSMMVFLALGFGLALPYLALCYVPALRHVLPKPGPWMETFRQFLAFPMFASAAWLVWVLSHQTEGFGVLTALMGMIILAFGIWLFEKSPKEKNTRRHILHGLAMLCVFIAVVFPITMMPKQTGFTPQTPETASSANFTRAHLMKVLDGNDPVFVNMTADWCITCKVNEHAVLGLTSIKALFEENNVTYIKGDWTNRNAEITDYLRSYGRQGVPLYVYYGPRDTATNARPDPAVLPQILTPGIIRDTIK